MSLAFARFETGLPSASVDRNLRQALVACDHAQAGVVLWLAEIQRRGLSRALGYPSPLPYATEALGMSRSRAYDLLQLARDLERLPLLREAMGAGRIGWTKARLVARVATAASEQAWVDAAQQLSRRALIERIAEEQKRARGRRDQRRRERAAQLAGQGDLGWAQDTPEAILCSIVTRPTPVITVHAAGAGDDTRSHPMPAPDDGPARSTTMAAIIPAVTPRQTRPATAAAEPPVTLTYRLTGLEHARYEALLEQAHRRRSVPPQASREQVLMTAMAALVNGSARAAIAAVSNGDDESSRLDVSILYQIIVYRCRDCGAAEVVTSSGRRRLSTAEADRAQCDARVLEPGAPNRASVAPTVRAAVLARDGHRCQSPGCGSNHFLEVHHVVPRREGGTNRTENLVTLCGRCHRFAHERPQFVRQWFAHRAASGVVP